MPIWPKDANSPSRRLTLQRQLRRLYANRHAIRFRFMSMERIFTDIYRRHVWRDPDSRSGSGSTERNTVKVRAVLPRWLGDLGAKTLLDVPCGDFNWLQHAELGVDHYIGADIVKALIDVNQQRHGSPQRRFMQLDICRSDLPQVDVVLCRDCLVHFSERAVLDALRNLIRSRSTYLITTTFPHQPHNTNIVTGYWQPTNLQRPPYNFPPPLKLITESDDSGQRLTKSLGLWAIADLNG